MANLHIPVNDYGGEGSSVDLPVADAIADADITTLFNAVDGVIIGAIGQSSLNLATAKDAGPGGAAADPFATRKGRWLVRYHDDTSLRKSRFTIACPDLALLVSGSDFMNIGAGAGATLVAALNAQGEGPDGNGMVVDNIEFRGRNIKPKKKS